MDDVVIDILRRVAATLLPNEAESERELARIEREVRREWGGERPYIAKAGESVRQQQSERDEQIRAAHRRGERIALLARRHGLSRRTVGRIIGE